MARPRRLLAGGRARAFLSTPLFLASGLTLLLATFLAGSAARLALLALAVHGRPASTR